MIVSGGSRQTRVGKRREMGGHAGEWSMAGKVINAGESGEWLHRIQLAQAMLDWGAVIRRI